MTYKYIITQSLAMLMSLASNAFEVKSGQPVVVSADTARMEPVAKTALKMLKGDIRKVLGSEMKLVNTSVNSSIILQRDAAAFAYKKEAFLLKSANGCLYIKGSDDHGLAYGILEVSRLLGVSPWKWWADAEPKQLKAFSLKEGYHYEQAPSVEYRGIFINDEVGDIAVQCGGIQLFLRGQLVVAVVVIGQCGLAVVVPDVQHTAQRYVQIAPGGVVQGMRQLQHEGRPRPQHDC